VSEGFDGFLAAAPVLQRCGMRLLMSLERRPRGAALLARAPLVHQAASSLVAMQRYDDPRLGAALGWDAGAVAARGRALRRAEGRP
jgi:hypothetical protein